MTTKNKPEKSSRNSFDTASLINDKDIHALPLLYQRIMMYTLRKAKLDAQKRNKRKLRSGTMLTESA